MTFHPKSNLGSHSSLNLFHHLPVQSEIERSHWQPLDSDASLESQGPITFRCPADGDYTDLANSFLHCQCHVTEENGGPLETGTKIAPINNMMHSLFDEIEFSINGTTLHAGDQMYQYRAYLETHQNYSRGVKKGWSSAHGWYRDSGGKMEQANDTNKGWEARRHLADKSGLIDLCGRLHLDLSFQERFLVDGLAMKWVLRRTRDSFALHAAPGEGKRRRLKIVACTL